MLCHGTVHSQVPVTTVTVMLVYCHQCDAWTRHITAGTQSGEHKIDVIELSDVEYGPFDDADTVHDDVCSSLMAILHSSGRPWDRGDAPKYRSVDDWFFEDEPGP